jgi:predicted transcriptional regulator
MKSKVMVEVGGLEELKKAIEAYEPWMDRNPEGHTRVLVELAQRVVAEEEKIQRLIDTPVDIDSSL